MSDAEQCNRAQQLAAAHRTPVGESVGVDVSEIRICRAAENNLKQVDLTLPLGKLVAFIGVSGSGKSSLAFDTLYSEGRRRYLDALGSVHPEQLPIPDVETIVGLPPTVGLSQRANRPDSRWTVGTFVGVHRLFQVLFRNDATLICPGCGEVMNAMPLDDMVSQVMALPDGSRLLVEGRIRVHDFDLALAEIVRQGFSRVRVAGEVKRVEEIEKHELEGGGELSVVVDRIRLSSDKLDRLYDALRLGLRVGKGTVRVSSDETTHDFSESPTCFTCQASYAHVDLATFSYFGQGACQPCSGEGCDECAHTRLGPVARAARWHDRTLHEWLDLTVGELLTTVVTLKVLEKNQALVSELLRRLEVLQQLGLMSLRLRWRCSELSGGEFQRLRLARLVGEPLTQVLYLLDEPAAGLDSSGLESVYALCRRLVDAGNTVVLVSHTPWLIERVDWVVEFGPGPGLSGGQVVFEGTYSELLGADTVSSTWLNGDRQLPRREARARRDRSCRLNNREIGLDGLGAFVGPTASGKSLCLSELQQRGERGELPFDHVVWFGSQVVGRSKRSTIATYSGLWDILRPLLAATQAAQIRGLKASHFSLNAKGGRCERCKGMGEERVDLGVLPSLFLRCSSCFGRRFHGDVLAVRWKGLTASEILALSVHEARLVLNGHPKLERILRVLEQVGLGYLKLGQAAHTWSGGEARRIGLARELISGDSKVSSTLYLLDNPEVGLHFEDQLTLHRALCGLVEKGATVWYATHDQAWIDAADHVESIRVESPRR